MKIRTFVLILVICICIGGVCIAGERDVVATNNENCMTASGLQLTDNRLILDDEYYPEGYRGYIYPIRPGMTEWSELKNHQEMVDACEIPEEILDKMTEEELAESILAYPLSIDMFAYDTTAEGVNVVKEHFGGMSALFKSETRGETLCSVYAKIKSSIGQSIGKNEAIKNSKACLVLSTLLHNDSFYGTLSNDSKRKIKQIERGQHVQNSSYSDINPVKAKIAPVTNSNNGALIAATKSSSATVQYVYRTEAIKRVIIKTPKGKSVQANVCRCIESTIKSNVLLDTKTYSDIPSYGKKYIEDEFFKTYGIRPKREATVKYNCHSYAWYSQSNTNGYWINDPSPYLNDGSYVEVTKLNVVAGDKIIYFKSQNQQYKGIGHSGIIKSYKAYSRGRRTFVVTSKWGCAGLYEHSWDNCPYFYNGGQFKSACDIKYYHKR